MARPPHGIRFSLAGLAGLACLAGLALATSGCDGCQRSRPFTPYTLGDGSAPFVDGGSAMAPAGDGGAFAVEVASPVPGDGQRWPLEGGAVEAPAGHTFAQGLVGDVDGDGKADLIAFARSPDGARGEVWFASGKSPGSGRVLAALPSELGTPGLAGCKTRFELRRISPSLVTFDAEAKCESIAHNRIARWVAVFRATQGASAGPELALELRAGPTADGESLRVELDGSDRDGDGRGDLLCTFTLDGAPKPLPGGGTASAAVAFFDRPAGLSRDPAEPEASWKTVSASLLADGRKRTLASRVGPNARAARRLHALLCDESGRSVVSTSAGPVRCGDVKLADDAATAEVEAAVNLADPFAAFAAMARIEGKPRKDLEALVAKLAPSIPGKLVRTTTTEPALSTGPAYGPVAILSTGDILIRARDRIVKVDHASFDEARVEAALSWPSRVGPLEGGDAGSAAAWKLAAIDERCDAPTLAAALQAGPESTLVPLPILDGRCPSATPATVDLLGTTSEGALVAVRGELVAIPLDAAPLPLLAENLAALPNAPQELGAARSPNGRVLAVSTSRGVLVASLKGSGRAATAKLWTAPHQDSAVACVPSDAADRIACVAKGRAVIYDAK